MTRYVCTLAVIAAIAAIGACGSPTEPTPVPASPWLMIVTPADGVAIGQQLNLTAAIGTGTADRRTVAAL